MTIQLLHFSNGLNIFSVALNRSWYWKIDILIGCQKYSKNVVHFWPLDFTKSPPEKYFDNEKN